MSWSGRDVSDTDAPPGDGWAVGQPLDLRLVPAALTAWSVSAAAIVWHPGAAVVAGLGAVGSTWLAARWGNGDGAGVTAAVLAVAAVAAGFAVAVGLRVYQVEHHPVSRLYGGTATVEVVPAETPRTIKGGRLMFGAVLRRIDQAPMSGRVLVFTPPGFAEVGPGRPATFRAGVGRPDRRDLSVAVLAASGQPSLGEASAVQRIAQQIRTGFAEAARVVLPADQAAMLPALVLGDTSAVTGTTIAQFRTSGLTHLSVLSTHGKIQPKGGVVPANFGRHARPIARRGTSRAGRSQAM